MRVIFSLFNFLLITLPVSAKTVHIMSEHRLGEALKYANTTYVIDESLNLKGRILQLPKNSILDFSSGGKINNGEIVGNNSIIKANAKLIFENIKIGGTWENTEVYSQWFQLSESQVSNDGVFSNLMQLCTGNKLTHFYMQKGTYYVAAVYRSAPIWVPSNVYWHNEATIKMLPTDMDRYNIVYLQKSNNVTIDGGAFIGDVESHKDKTGEWGHGIKCGGASNVVIKNVTCSYCWGDGIDLIEGLDENKKPTLNCNRITIDNVKCFYNRRQGISIEAASNVKITNSEFAYTGFPKYTSPGAGLDIEPWTDNKDKVWNITIVNCRFHDNRGLDVQCEPNVRKEKSFAKLHNNINFSKCDIGSMRIRYTKNITLLGCNVSKALYVLWADGVRLRKTTIEKYVKGEKLNNIKIIDCKIRPNLLSYTVPVVGVSALVLFVIAKYKNVI